MKIDYVLEKVRAGCRTSSEIAEQYILENGGTDRYFRVRASVSPKLAALERQGYIRRTGGAKDSPSIYWEAVE